MFNPDEESSTWLSIFLWGVAIILVVVSCYLVYDMAQRNEIVMVTIQEHNQKLNQTLDVIEHNLGIKKD